jgi:hypothetical protein
MAKFATGEEKRFSPISQKLLDAVSGPAQMRHEEPEPLKPEPKIVQLRTGVEKPLQPETDYNPETPEPDIDESERLTKAMRYHVSPSERDETEDFIRRLSVAAKVSLTHSNVMRACRDMLFQVEDRLISELSKAKLRRPINEKRAIAFFEARLTEIIRNAVRQSPLSHNRNGRE